MKSLQHKSFKTMLQYTPEEIKYFLDLAAKLKADKKAGKEIKTDNSEAQNFIRAVMQNYQKLIGDVLGKVDTAVLSGMSLAADYYEATKESFKEE